MSDDPRDMIAADRRQTFGDMEQTYLRWKNGVRYDVLAKEQGVTRERMRHRLTRYENDKVRQLEAENARLREALRFYADAENYKWQPKECACGCCDSWHAPIIHEDGHDSGQIALAALQKTSND